MTHFLLNAATNYINKGRAVLILADNKIPFRGCDDCTGVSTQAHYVECVCIKTGKLCHGFYGATRDPDVLRRWLEEYPEASGIAQRTGEASGVFVLETDPKNGGDASLAALEAEHGSLPMTEMHMSQSGGIHYTFTLPEGMEVRQHIQKFAAGVDIKGEGGYAVLPPSKGEKGTYRSLNEASPVPAPGWVLDRIAELQKPTGHTGEFRTFEPGQVPANISSDAQQTIRYWTGRIATADDGEQNKLIYTTSRLLHSLAFAGVINEDDVDELILNAAEDGNHPRDRALKAIESGRKAAVSSPDTLEQALNKRGTYVDGQFNKKYSLDVPGTYSRFLAKHQHDIAFIPERKVWASYSDRDGMWNLGNPSKTTSDKSVVKHHVTDTLFNLRATESHLWGEQQVTGGEKTYRDLFEAYVSKVNASTAMNKSVMETLDYNTPSTDGVYAPTLAFNQFDSRADILPFRNGLVELETGEFRPYVKEDRVTECLPWDYRKSADCPEFKAYLNRAQPDPEIQDYLQRVAGYTIQGSTSEKRFFIHQGIADGGKSTFAMILAAILSHFAHTADRDLFHKGGEETSEKKANLFRKRMILLDEWQISEKVNAALLKSVAAGSPDNGRFLYGQDFGFRHTGKIHITTNADVKMDLDSGLITRLTVIPWNSPVSKEEKERQSDKFGGIDFNAWVCENELMGIVNWAIEGYRKWRQVGLGDMPKALEEAKQEYLESDPVKSFFFNEYVWTRDPNDKVTAVDFYDDFVSSFQGPREEIEQYTRTKVNSALKGLQVTVKNARVNGSNPTTAFIGIKRKEG
ncbi:phage/plasmid primase, P4 family [Streptomyces xanthophaeus]|uniref:phage/plasmid primase, P4 family n=1 Tax=Streptomyces xanthophaeus TaxID=67385 RepID=UPI00386612B6|nr:phage/plasmid primase, P4 family [Streptomyces xanthophaeus]